MVIDEFILSELLWAKHSDWCFSKFLSCFPMAWLKKNSCSLEEDFPTVFLRTPLLRRSYVQFPLLYWKVLFNVVLGNWKSIFWSCSIIKASLLAPLACDILLVYNSWRPVGGMGNLSLALLRPQTLQSSVLSVLLQLPNAFIDVGSCLSCHWAVMKQFVCWMPECFKTLQSTCHQRDLCGWHLWDGKQEYKAQSICFRELGWFSVENRRLKGDLVTLQIPVVRWLSVSFSRYWAIGWEETAQVVTRGFRLDVRKIIISERLIRHWNRLPCEGVEPPSLEMFRSCVGVGMLETWFSGDLAVLC